jgi:Holliday junction resolvase
MEQILNREASPFFQHFATMRVGPFSSEASGRLLKDLFEKSGYTVAEDVILKVSELAGGNPFYLQVVGEELCKNTSGRRPDSDTLKATIQQLLFSSGGRLYAYCEALFAETVKNSSSLQRVLASIGSGHQTPTAISRNLRIPVGTVNSYLVRLTDLDLIKKTNGVYDVVDTLFKLWVTGTKTPLRSMISPYMLGTEAEKLVAERLSKEGFYVLFAPASRGAFDLLAILNGRHVGVQVKRTEGHSYYISHEAYQRMLNTAHKLGWAPAIATVTSEPPQIRYFPLEALRRTRDTYRINGSTAGYETLSGLVFARAS